jgi:hypothetical protein
MLRNTLPAQTLLLSMCLFGIASCTTLRAGSDYYTEADFTAYRSFAWVADSPLIRSQSDRVQISQLNIRRIREAIERDLIAKGFNLVLDRAAADFGVSFTVGARDQIRVDDYPVFYRGRWRWGPPYYWPNVDVYMYTEGTLAIDIFDNATRQPVWHGWARKQVVGADITNPDRAIDAAVAAILDDFPPRPER